MSSHGEISAVKTKKKKRASLDQAADTAPKAKKQKQAFAGPTAAQTPADTIPPANGTDTRRISSKKKRKAVEGEEKMSVKAAKVEVEEQPFAASEVSRKEAKLQRKLARTAAAAAAAAGVAAHEEAKAPAVKGRQSPEIGLKAKKGKKRKAAEALEAADAAAPQGAPEAAPSPADSAPAKKVKREKVKHAQQEVDLPAELETVPPDAATLAAQGDPAVGTKEMKKKKKQKQKAGAAETAEEAPAAKPAADRADEQVADGSAGATEALKASSGPAKESAPPSNGNRNGDRAGKAPSFQRVNADEWLNKKGAWDNSYEATFGNGGWGAGAQAVLGQVRGKDFRHEKTKKKRGTYRGGQIDHNVNSFKFESDDE